MPERLALVAYAAWVARSSRDWTLLTESPRGLPQPPDVRPRRASHAEGLLGHHQVEHRPARVLADRGAVEGPDGHGPRRGAGDRRAAGVRVGHVPGEVLADAHRAG